MPDSPQAAPPVVQTHGHRTAVHTPSMLARVIQGPHELGGCIRVLCPHEASPGQHVTVSVDGQEVRAPVRTCMLYVRKRLVCVAVQILVLIPDGTRGGEEFVVDSVGLEMSC